ncbi:probable 2-ketogluconate reductase isoform X3 [Apteryx mantelli]|uniref:Probable 2-ketogluconate reductase isoform X3 n=1 Tax=Apteryx mantelli TaxID=2696672 RepID=A0A8B7IBR4_9AVES
MTILKKEHEEQLVGAICCEKIDSLLQQSDFVMVVVSLTPQTHKLIGKREMELMKPMATLINISRGAVVDQEALVRALQAGVIRAAALDVTYPEPLPRLPSVFSSQKHAHDSAVRVPGALREAQQARRWQRLPPPGFHILDMEDQELPYVLIDCIGGKHGVYEDHVEFLKKHFCLITMKEYLENKKFLGEKITAIYMWYHKPVIDEELLQILPNLKVVANSGVGIDHLDLNLLSSFGVKVSNTPFVASMDTADLGMALMLASARRLVEGYQMAVSPDTEYFPADWLGVEVSGTTLGIIGMGTIGYKVAQRAKAFDMKILYHNRNQRNKEEESAVGAIYCKKIDDLLQQSDFVMLAVTLTPQTHKLIGKRELELMKPTATLINISRGLVVDQDALVEALQNKVIKAAALDVTYPEPLPRDHPLLKMKNVIITPHIGSATKETRRLMMKNMTESIEAALTGLPIPNEVLL